MLIRFWDHTLFIVTCVKKDFDQFINYIISGNILWQFAPLTLPIMNLFYVKNLYESAPPLQLTVKKKLSVVMATTFGHKIDNFDGPFDFA